MFIMVTAHRKKLRPLMNIILALYPEDIVIPINDSMSSVQFVLHNPVDLIYAHQSTPPVDILSTGRMIHNSCPDIPMYMIADTEKYISQAAESGYSGYFLEPVSAESLQNGNLLKPMEVRHL